MTNRLKASNLAHIHIMETIQSKFRRGVSERTEKKIGNKQSLQLAATSNTYIMFIFRPGDLLISLGILW